MLTGVTLFFSACDTLKKFPTNTSGGIFSLNGNWKLTTTTDNNAQMGTVVTVAPAIASAFVKSLENNSYCYRAGDEAWKTVSTKINGGFTIKLLTSACSGNQVYKDGEITVITNDLIRINSKNNIEQALVQEWTRVIK